MVAARAVIVGGATVGRAAVHVGVAGAMHEAVAVNPGSAAATQAEAHYQGYDDNAN